MSDYPRRRREVHQVDENGWSTRVAAHPEATRRAEQVVMAIGAALDAAREGRWSDWREHWKRVEGMARSAALWRGDRDRG